MHFNIEKNTLGKALKLISEIKIKTNDVIISQHVFDLKADDLLTIT